ncbi:MAG: type III polyketide synthase [Planctomycetota bacterium]|nr:type III polyketide synthase [Planctomycetota bacterium]
MSRTIDQSRTTIGLPLEQDIPARSEAILMGLGHAQPSIRLSQHESETRIATALKLTNDRRDRWRRIIKGSGIEHRTIAMDIEQVIDLGTAERMQAYERLAPPLGEESSRRALASSGIVPEKITDLIVVSCTGFAAPGLDTSLVERLGLSRSVRRTVIGFMGCYGGIVGLRQASAICRADPMARALVVCVELCSLHVRNDPRGDNLVSLALFADGAAAAVVRGSDDRDHIDSRTQSGGIGSLTRGSSLLIPEGREWMTWNVTDTGFAMTLTRDVPVVLRRRLRSFVANIQSPTPKTYAIHPGGPGILQAVDDALELKGGFGLQAARRVLRDHGNMSSGTVLVVLEELRRNERELPITLLAFGPGLTVEEISLIA